ncbi:MAG: tRNA (adenosine(37)-N6)-threonylcarbamoyltransferase complex ATPase subunit type 1 TsaE [Gammaproteobacteria bacterium]|nr:tRNA (adenosine(37)-N6)-threonylcarbamoyltransferase complex ATPase subunit type 1 TsaE [Gammaproteobacteria bacterium]
MSTTRLYREYLIDETATLNFGARLAKATFSRPFCGLPTVFGHSADAPATRAHGSTPVTGIASTGGFIHLNGDLGVGKTTLARGLLRGFGFTGAVKSPTYTLVEAYEFEQCSIYHLDFYRLEFAREVMVLGIDGYFQEKNLCLVEWAENGRGYIAAPDLIINLSDTGTGRDLVCQSRTTKGETILKRL